MVELYHWVRHARFLTSEVRLDSTFETKATTDVIVIRRHARYTAHCIRYLLGSTRAIAWMDQRLSVQHSCSYSSSIFIGDQNCIGDFTPPVIQVTQSLHHPSGDRGSTQEIMLQLLVKWPRYHALTYFSSLFLLLERDTNNNPRCLESCSKPR